MIMGEDMKKLISLTFLILCFALVLIYRNDIINFAVRLVRNDKPAILNYKNDYYREDIFQYVSLVDDFMIKDSHQLFNAYYTIINSGIDTFSFYCDDSYENCIDDVITLADNRKQLSILNGYVHPFNNFSSIETVYDSFGKVTIKINKAYTKEQIDEINQKVDEIIASEIDDTMSDREKIKAIHDYIITHTKYDKGKSDNNVTKYHSGIAYGPLLEGYAICGGYTDAMAIFLNRFHIPTFSVTSENHIWNAVYLDNAWYHLDLTWDDPFTTSGIDVLDYNYFLIKTSELEEKDEKKQHIYDKEVFPELAY